MRSGGKETIIGKSNNLRNILIAVYLPQTKSPAALAWKHEVIENVQYKSIKVVNIN